MAIAAACSFVVFTTPVDAASTAPRPGNAGGFEVDTGDETLFSGDGDSIPGVSAPTGLDDWAQGASGTGVLNSDGSPNAPSTVLFVDPNWGNSSPDPNDPTKFAGQSNKNDDLIGVGPDGIPNTGDDDDDPWDWDGTGGGPQKNDLTNVYVHLRTVSGEQWVVFAAETRSDNGDSHVDFEFNQAGLLQTGAIAGEIFGLGPAGGRTLNDFVATVDLENGGVAVLPSFRLWDDVGLNYVLQDLDNPPYDDAVFVTANDLAIVHSAATAPWHHYEGDGGISPTGTVGTFQLVEIAVNLGEFGITVDVCDNNTTVMAKTRSSQSFTAELKDFALFFPFEGTVPSCEITGPGLVCPGDQGLIYTAIATIPDEEELVAFLLGDGQRQRGFDINRDGAVTVSDLAALVAPAPETIVSRRVAVPADPFTYDWTLTGDAEFCGGGTTASGVSVCVNADDECDAGFVLSVIVTADPCTSECDFIVVIDDVVSPEITCPADVTYECDDIGNPGVATATDDCDDAVDIGYSDSVSPGCGSSEVITRTWTATDDCGNSDSCVQIITIVDTTSPEITCPSDLSFECDDVGDFGEATATDNCDPNPTVTIVSSSETGTCPTVITRTFRATDDCGNYSECTQTITIDDTTDPVITCPADVTFECVIGDFGAATATDNCDPNPVVSIASSDESGTCPTIISIIWQAVDSCGNVATCEQTVTIDDTIPPEITCPPDETIECPATPSPGTPEVTDSCDPNPVWTVSEVPAAGECLDIASVTYLYTAMDSCGNISTCEQTVTVVDTTPPVIAECPPDVTYECDAVPDFDVPTATDDCDPSPEVTVETDVQDDGCTETITRTFIAVDACGNVATCEQVITITDTTDPVITCPADVDIECDQDTGEYGSATATDNCSTPEVTLIVNQVVQEICPRIIRRVYQAEDACGNVATCEQSIIIRDTTAPVITCPGDMSFECDNVGDFGTATATDNCDPNPTVSLLSSSEEGDECLTVITRVFQAQDVCGNTATCEQTITIADTTAPEINCPADMMIECDTPTILTALAVDNCDPSPVISCEVIDAQVPDAFSVVDLGNGQLQITLPITNTIIVQCIATDRCGLTSAPCTFEVTAVCRSFEGCTPGYWKQPHHWDSWPAPYTPDTLFCDVFGLNASGEAAPAPGAECAFPGLTFLQVLRLEGSAEPGPNQLNNLGRHTVAALLNAASPGVEYDLTPEEVIGLFDLTYPQADPNNYQPLHFLYANLNELGCPLN